MEHLLHCTVSAVLWKKGNKRSLSCGVACNKCDLRESAAVCCEYSAKRLIHVFTTYSLISNIYIFIYSNIYTTYRIYFFRNSSGPPKRMSHTSFSPKDIHFSNLSNSNDLVSVCWWIRYSTLTCVKYCLRVMSMNSTICGFLALHSGILPLMIVESFHCWINVSFLRGLCEVFALNLVMRYKINA